MKTLSDIFYTTPRYANTTMDKKDLKELLLHSDGWIMACGHMWDIGSKHIGAGVYRVTLKERSYKWQKRRNELWKRKKWQRKNENKAYGITARPWMLKWLSPNRDGTKNGQMTESTTKIMATILNKWYSYDYTTDNIPDSRPHYTHNLFSNRSDVWYVSSILTDMLWNYASTGANWCIPKKESNKLQTYTIGKRYERERKNSEVS